MQSFSRFLLIISSQTGNKEINVHEYSEICKIVCLAGILKKNTCRSQDSGRCGQTFLKIPTKISGLDLYKRIFLNK